MGYNLGLRWQPIEKVSIGATFRSSATVTLNGQTEYELQPYPGLPTPRTSPHTWTSVSLHRRLWHFLPAHAQMEY